MLTVKRVAYVRTSSGVAQVLPGDCVPDDAIPGELDRLTGVLVDDDPEVTVDEDVLPQPRPRRKGSKGS